MFFLLCLIRWKPAFGKLCEVLLLASFSCFANQRYLEGDSDDYDIVFFPPASPTNFVTICVVHFFQPGLDICFIFVLFLLTWVGGEALSFGGFLSNASPSRGKLRIGFMFLQRDLIFSKNNLLMFKNYLIQTN